MSDTHLGDIVVTGQRRLPGGQFPSRSGGGTGGGAGDDDGTPHQNDDEPADPNPEAQPWNDPCAVPATALEWNADAAMAEAGKEFARRASAQGEDLNTREWSVILYGNADGSVRLGPINSGPEFRFGGVGRVPLIEDGPRSEIVGFGHSHRSGNHLPSSGNDIEPGTSRF